MTDLSWNRFLEVAGDPRRNFEVLCRELIRRHYGSLGPLLTRKQQPGVEFHLRIERPSEAFGARGRGGGGRAVGSAPDEFGGKAGGLLQNQRKKMGKASGRTLAHKPASRIGCFGRGR